MAKVNFALVIDSDEQWRLQTKLPEDVEKMDRQETEAEHEDDSNQHLGNVTSCQHPTASILDPVPRQVTVSRVIGRRVETTRRRRYVLWKAQLRLLSCARKIAMNSRTSDRSTQNSAKDSLFQPRAIQFIKFRNK